MVPSLFGSPYVLPWYPGWVLPVLSSVRRHWISVAVTIQSLLLLAVDPDRFARFRGAFRPVLKSIAIGVLPVLEIAVLVALCVTGVRALLQARRRRYERSAEMTSAA